MATALFRVTLWQTKKKGETLSRFVAVDNVESAVCLARQWVSWANSKGRGKRAKFDRWRVEERDSEKRWHVKREGDKKDAETQYPQENETESEARTKPATNVSREKAIRAFGRPKRSTGRQPKSRLAELVAKVKARQ